MSDAAAAQPLPPRHSARSALSVRGLAKCFDDKTVLQDIHLDLAVGEVIALLGPSGCGKTTLLRIIAGLMAPSHGSLFLNGQKVADGERNLGIPPEERGLGMVFQDYALWPHLSVLNNVAFPLRMQGQPRKQRQQRALEALRRVGLEHLANRAPGTLSGGQQQRVALARAIVSEPPLVLFDEPLSNLDRELRENLALDIAQLLRELDLSAVYVTHDQAEAFAVADRVAVILDGHIAQLETPVGLFQQPASLDVARFLNIGALFAGEIRQGVFHCEDLATTVTWDLPGSLVEGPGHLLIPRAALRVEMDRPSDAAPTTPELVVNVLRCQFQGDRYLLQVQPQSGTARSNFVCHSDHAAKPGQALRLAVDRQQIRVFS